jgi:membrane peptidoglycan carboxypeptidase
LTAALESGYSIKSMVNPTALKSKKDGGTDEITLGNANREGELTCTTFCTLEEMTIKSYNVPFYNIAKEIGAGKVIDTAQRAGVGRMWAVDSDKSYDLNTDPQGKNRFDAYVGFGKYPITVIDHASGTATLANHGTYFKPHFVMKVEKKNNKTGKFEIVPGVGEVLKGEPRIKPQIADEVTSVLKQISKSHALDGGRRETAGKTGTWEADPEKFPSENSNAWFVGYTDQLAGAVWVGNKGDELPLRTKPPVTGKNGKLNYAQGEKIGGSGLPGELFEQIMNLAHKNLALKAVSLPNSTGIGNPERGNGVSPTPVAPGCMFPLLCPTQSPGAGGPGGGGGGGNGGWPQPKPSTSTSPRPR